MPLQVSEISVRRRFSLVQSHVVHSARIFDLTLIQSPKDGGELLVLWFSLCLGSGLI